MTQPPRAPRFTLLAALLTLAGCDRAPSPPPSPKIAVAIAPDAPVVLPFSDLDPVLAPSGDLGIFGLLLFEPILRLDRSGEWRSDLLELPLGVRHDVTIRLDPSARLPNRRPCNAGALLQYLSHLAPSDRVAPLRSAVAAGVDAVRLSSDRILPDLQALLDELLGPGRAKTDVDAERTAFTLRLKTGAAWGDGRPIRSADLAAAFRRAARVAPRRIAGLLDRIESPETPDDRTCVIRARGLTPDPLVAACFLGPWPTHRLPPEGPTRGLRVSLGDAATGLLRLETVPALRLLRNPAAAAPPVGEIAVDWPVVFRDDLPPPSTDGYSLDQIGLAEIPLNESLRLYSKDPSASHPATLVLPPHRGIVLTFPKSTDSLGDPRVRRSLCALFDRLDTRNVLGIRNEPEPGYPLPGRTATGPPPFDASRLRSLFSRPLSLSTEGGLVQEGAATEIRNRLEQEGISINRVGPMPRTDPRRGDLDLYVEWMSLDPRGPDDHPLLSPLPGMNDVPAAAGRLALLMEGEARRLALEKTFAQIETDWPGVILFRPVRLLMGRNDRIDLFSSLHHTLLDAR